MIMFKKKRWSVGSQTLNDKCDWCSEVRKIRLVVFDYGGKMWLCDNCRRPETLEEIREAES